MVPTLTTLLTGIASQLTDYENWDTTESYESAMITEDIHLELRNIVSSHFFDGFCLRPVRKPDCPVPGYF